MLHEWLQILASDQDCITQLELARKTQAQRTFDAARKRIMTRRIRSIRPASLIERQMMKLHQSVCSRQEVRRTKTIDGHGSRPAFVAYMLNGWARFF